MKVSEYRELTNDVIRGLTDCSACVTENEAVAARDYLARIANELRTAECSRANAYDTTRAVNVLIRVDEKLSSPVSFSTGSENGSAMWANFAAKYPNFAGATR